MKITQDHLDRMSADYAKRHTQHVAEVAVKNNGIDESAERESVVITDNAFVFSIDVDSEVVANQRQSGRCWMYACLNTLRWHIEKDLKLPKGSFELSQTYNFFFDKIEKSNAFLENIQKYAKEDIDDRRISFLLATPQQDGGDFDPIVDLVQKYGVVPLKEMPDTAPSKNTANLNAVLNELLRKDAYIIRDMVRGGASDSDLEDKKLEMLGEVYRMMAVSFGEPPKKFDFEYRDKDGKYHVDRGLTPKEFYKKYVPVDLSDYVGVTNIPTSATPYNRMLTIDMTNEVMSAERQLHYLNVDIDTLKKLCVEQLKGDEPIWFGCDVTQDSDFQKGIMSKDLYDYDQLFGIDLSMTKEQSYQAHQSAPTHAMVLAGVDLDENGKPTKWKVENSWGEKAHGKPVGHQGYFIMDDTWFDAYMFEAAINKKYMSKELLKVLDEEPIVMPYWSPFNPLP